MRTIYFDYNATTPLDPEVGAAMQPYFAAEWGNPSSIHHVGRRARALLDEMRDRAAALFGSKPSEVVFTSGGTESNNLAIFGTARRLRTRGRHLITSAIEHHAVLNCFEYLARQEGFEVTVLPVDREGRVSPENLRRTLRPDTILVSIMAANNEVGTLQPIAELGSICRERGVIFHTDAAQWFGKEPFTNIHQFNADLVTVCAHKFHGPKGAGALFIRSPLLPDPIIFGGGHENERRAGTENLPAIAGLVRAMELFLRQPVFPTEPLRIMTQQLAQTIQLIEGVTLVGSPAQRLANTVAFVVNGTDSFALLAGLDVEGICASAGAACSAGSLEPSHVVSALGFDAQLARSLVRFSLGRENTNDEIEAVARLLPAIVRRAQSGR
ncbi:MAG TPA: cysteine desulfurase family protein [Verrucomicrobiae bacterium]|nr:cysteine desulfurase family protein [Verrucomicrobiae bacterium]